MGAIELVIVEGDSATKDHSFRDIVYVERRECVAANNANHSICDPLAEPRDHTLMDNSVFAVRCYGGCPQQLCSRCGNGAA